jgi:hypothetical protein
MVGRKRLGRKDIQSGVADDLRFDCAKQRFLVNQSTPADVDDVRAGSAVPK